MRCPADLAFPGVPMATSRVRVVLKRSYSFVSVRLRALGIRAGFRYVLAGKYEIGLFLDSVCLWFGVAALLGLLMLLITLNGTQRMARSRTILYSGWLIFPGGRVTVIHLNSGYHSVFVECR